MKHIRLPAGESVPALGQGTWNIGDDPGKRQEEIAALQLGIDLGLTLIDTAEMYGEGRSESLVGEAIAGRRDAVFLVTKVYPHNASRKAMQAACDASLKRLRTDVIDLYLLHWPGQVPLAETVETFEVLRRAGKIRHWGVSNFDAKRMAALESVPGGSSVQTDQVLYNLERRGAEWDLLPALRRHGIPAMAYSPMGLGRLLTAPRLVAFAQRHAMTPAQAALAWVLAQDGVIVIPKSGNRQRVTENAAALEHALTAEQLRELGALFPPPKGGSALDMI